MDKDALLAPRLPEDDVDIPGVGTVRVRGLSRDEVLAAQNESDNLPAFERRLISCGMVDPQLSVAEAGRWQLGSPAGEIEPVIDRIRALSGLGGDASKSGVAPDAAASGAGVRALSGGAAGDDRGPDAGGDE